MTAKNETLIQIENVGICFKRRNSILSDIYAPDRGSIIKKESCKVSLLSLQAGFIPYLSGKKNIFINGLLLGMEKSYIEENLTHIIDFSELHDFIDEPVETYSAGMRARLGFSTALYMQPDIVLIDEVLGVGDKSFRQKSSTAIKSKIQQGMTAVIVSHNANTIRSLCDRVIWIEDGQVKADGPTEDVIKKYEK